MDLVTHAFLGGLSVQLGLRQRIGRDATWAAAIAAMLPDLDILIAPMLALGNVELDTLASIRFHRGITHSLLAMPVYSVALATIWWVIRWRVRKREEQQFAVQPRRRPTSFWMLYLCTAVAVLTHALPDFCTSYGTQLFSPLTSNRYAADSIAIVDILYTPLLGITLLAIYIVRKAARSTAAQSTFIIAAVGLGLSLGYMYSGRLLHNRAVEKTVEFARQNQLIREGDTLLAADAYPALGTIFLWRGLLETDRYWIAARYHCFAGSGQPIRFSIAPKQTDEWIERARREVPDVATFYWFAMGRVRTLHEKVNGDHVILFYDERYAQQLDSLGSMWSLRVVYSDSGELITSQFQGGRHRRQSFGQLVHRAWQDIWNP